MNPQPYRPNLGYGSAQKSLKEMGDEELAHHPGEAGHQEELDRRQAEALAQQREVQERGRHHEVTQQREHQLLVLQQLVTGQADLKKKAGEIHRIDWWILVVGIVAALAGVVAAIATVILLVRAFRLGTGG